MALSLKHTAFKEVSQYPSITLAYAPWCGHCKRFLPEYNSFAEKFGTTQGSEASSSLPLVTKIDAHKYGSHLKSGDYLGANEIRGFPTTLFYHGDGNTYEVYNGPRTAEALKAGWQEFQANQK